MVGFCFDYLIPGAIMKAGAYSKAAAGLTALLEPSNPFLDRVLRMQLPIYVTLLGRWDELWNAAHNPQSPWYNPASPPPTVSHLFIYLYIHKYLFISQANLISHSFPLHVQL